MVETSNQAGRTGEQRQTAFRKSLQALLPVQLTENQTTKQGYNIYPFHSLGDGKINNGYPGLAKWLADYRCVIIDGSCGVLWDDVQACLQDACTALGLKIHWIGISQFLLPAGEISQLVVPFMGRRDSVWGTKTTLQLPDFFRMNEIADIKIDKGSDCTIIVGTGAALSRVDAPVVYLDVPKNEIQYRARAGSITNLGMTDADEPAHMYKQFYFVDWVVLKTHQASIRSRITIRGDAQWKSTLNWMLAKDLDNGLQELSHTVLRVRPWFEAGAWGGQWMKEHIGGLNTDEINYAWSFELIVPENGIVFESDGYLLEVPFDLLMLAHHKDIIGRHAGFFGTEFPIRFDFLDTWDGGNLSIQCHPSLSYIRKHFGEHITQDETYYILDCKEDATVYLGFQEGIDAAHFKTVLQESKSYGKEINVTDYVQAHPAYKHDLFLIPNGTVHGAGAGNLVLEISATPYIFTFKMYDWLRLDLNGEPRAINIEHAYNNLRFERQGGMVKKELVSKPALLENGPGYEVWHLPTHAEHLYDVHRLEFDQEIAVGIHDSCHVLMLVEGTSVLVQSGKATNRFFYAETFVIPAAAQGYTIINEGNNKAKLVKAFIKDSIDFLS